MNRDTGTRSADIDLGFTDLNTVSETDLANIPWIGRERAQAIIHQRPFGSMEDVRRVPGMTDDVMEALLRGGVMVGNPTPAGGG